MALAGGEEGDRREQNQSLLPDEGLLPKRKALPEPYFPGGRKCLPLQPHQRLCGGPRWGMLQPAKGREEPSHSTGGRSRGSQP